MNNEALQKRIKLVHGEEVSLSVIDMIVAHTRGEQSTKRKTAQRGYIITNNTITDNGEREAFEALCFEPSDGTDACLRKIVDGKYAYPLFERMFQCYCTGLEQGKRIENEAALYYLEIIKGATMVPNREHVLFSIENAISQMKARIK